MGLRVQYYVSDKMLLYPYSEMLGNSLKRCSSVSLVFKGVFSGRDHDKALPY